MKKHFLIFVCLVQSTLSFSQSLFDSTSVQNSFLILFQTGQYELDKNANQALVDFYQIYQQNNADKIIFLTAHTDSIGNQQANQILSEKRAKTVQEKLLSFGIQAEKIEIHSLGETKPLTTNEHEEGRQQNRSVQLNFVTKIPMAKVSGQVLDEKTGKGILAQVYFNSKTRKDSVQTDTLGSYEVFLPKDSVVRIEIVAKDHFFETYMMHVYGPIQKEKFNAQQNIKSKLTPAEIGAKKEIPNVHFKPNSPELTLISQKNLSQLLKTMTALSGYSFEISGHINEPGISPEKCSNFKLSEERAETIYNYLIKNGLEPSRLTWKGYGNSEMLFPKAVSLDHQARNRRVEIKITGKYEK